MFWLNEARDAKMAAEQAEREIKDESVEAEG